MSVLTAGAARSIINPELGIEKIGLRLFGGPIQWVESDLTVTAVVLADQSQKVAVIACDLCVVPLEVLLEVRRRVGKAIGTSTSHVMINLSHNHSAPSFPGWLEGTPEQDEMKNAYQDSFVQRVVEACREADRTAREARIAEGWGESKIGVYRRETGPDGQDILGEVQGHPIDPSVGVIRVDDLAGNPIATLFSYGCHPVTVGTNSMVASTDFPGPAREVIETRLGGLALFLQGCGGNINPSVGIGYAVDCRETKRMVGTMLGAEALKVAVGLLTHLRRGERRTLREIPNILFTPWERVSGETCTRLDAADRMIELEFSKLPPPEEAGRVHDEWQHTLQEKRARGAQDWEIRVASKFLQWSRNLLEATRKGHPTHPVLLQAVRINDILLVGLSLEAFFETGMAIKAASPVAHTQVLGYTNGSTCYLPRAEDYPPGGWKWTERYHVPDLFVQSYALPVALHPGAEQEVVKETLALITDLG